MEERTKRIVIFAVALILAVTVLYVIVFPEATGEWGWSFRRWFRPIYVAPAPVANPSVTSEATSAYNFVVDKGVQITTRCSSGHYQISLTYCGATVDSVDCTITDPGYVTGSSVSKTQTMVCSKAGTYTVKGKAVAGGKTATKSIQVTIVEAAGYETVKIGNNLIEYTDAGGVKHSIPMAIKLSLSTSGTTFTFDTKTIWYKVNTINNIITFRKNSATGDLVTEQDYVDGNADALVFATPFTLTGSNEQYYEYRIYVTETYGDVWLLLSYGSFYYGGGLEWIKFGGTDDTESGGHKLYYLPDSFEFGGNSTDDQYYVARFVINEGSGGSQITSYFDTSSGKLITPSGDLSYYDAQVVYDSTKKLTDGTATTAYGTKLTALNGVLTAEIPIK